MSWMTSSILSTYFSRFIMMRVHLFSKDNLSERLPNKQKINFQFNQKNDYFLANLWQQKWIQTVVRLIMKLPFQHTKSSI